MQYCYAECLLCRSYAMDKYYKTFTDVIYGFS
jgi:hypothetical protein